MDSKFYVSYEAARLLKEKGYRDETMYGYSSEDQSMNTLDVREDYDWNDPNNEFHSTETREYVEMFAAPTKSEAIDWLESKGIIVEFQYYQEFSTWNYAIYFIIYTYSDEEFPTRLEAEDAAIIKALELL